MIIKEPHNLRLFYWGGWTNIPTNTYRNELCGSSDSLLAKTIGVKGSINVERTLHKTLA